MYTENGLLLEITRRPCPALEVSGPSISRNYLFKCALREASLSEVFRRKRDRPTLKAALDYMREGDTLVVWKLDRLARSLRSELV